VLRRLHGKVIAGGKPLDRDGYFIAQGYPWVAARLSY
jgi:hypothetical protein